MARQKQKKTKDPNKWRLQISTIWYWGEYNKKQNYGLTNVNTEEKF